jgi:hypothetical protein
LGIERLEPKRRTVATDGTLKGRAEATSFPDRVLLRQLRADDSVLAFLRTC